MPKFRKKPVVIEAEQYHYGRMLSPSASGVCVSLKCDNANPHIHTLEGLMTVGNGDWVITGVQGERYPCKPDIFEQTYEPVEE